MYHFIELWIVYQTAHFNRIRGISPQVKRYSIRLMLDVVHWYKYIFICHTRIIYTDTIVYDIDACLINHNHWNRALLDIKQYKQLAFSIDIGDSYIIYNKQMSCYHTTIHSVHACMGEPAVTLRLLFCKWALSVRSL